jgi:hypothetical protein
MAKIKSILGSMEELFSYLMKNHHPLFSQIVLFAFFANYLARNYTE